MGSANSSRKKKHSNRDTQTNRGSAEEDEGAKGGHDGKEEEGGGHDERSREQAATTGEKSVEDVKEADQSGTSEERKHVLKRLHVACQKENTAVVNALMSTHGSSVVERDPDSGKVALHFCISNKRTETAEAVYKFEPSCLNIKDQAGFTPLLLAAVAGNLEMVKFLHEKGSSVKTADNEGHSASHWAAVCGHEEILEYLQESGADLSAVDKNGATPLHYAVHGNDDVTQEKSLKMTKMLLDKNVNVDASDEDGRTPLLWAASSGREKICRLLLDAGANVESSDRDKLTGLHSAAAKGHPRCIEVLLERKATIEAADKNGCTPLFYAIHQSEMDCAKLLLNKKANPNHCDAKGRSVSHCAASAGNMEAMKLLKHHKADLWLRSKETGDLPIHEASMAGHTEIVQFLMDGLDDKAAKKGAINKGNTKGKTCLHMAALSNNLPLCKYLVDNGANVNAPMKHDNEELLPYDCAVLKNNSECAKYLMQNGARSGRTSDNQGDEPKKQALSKESSCQTDNDGVKKQVEAVDTECQTIQPKPKKTIDKAIQSPAKASPKEIKNSGQMADKGIQTVEMDPSNKKDAKTKSPGKGKKQKSSEAEEEEGEEEEKNKDRHSSDEGEDSGTYSEEEKQNSKKKEPHKNSRNKIPLRTTIEDRRLVNLNVHPAIIREQVRAYETKRLAAMKLNHSNRMKMNGKGFSEERLVKKLARDYNEDARQEDRIPSSHFKTLKDFDNFLRGEINIADVDEKRLRKLEKVKPIYYITF